ncbi:hypothetical protein TWF718_001558 [Orbilia javanica]|uniref:Uncharacterized protein n=1 Tax=Orbilia javanica TaxID=47235 RepID=A0AAN8P2P8_9PEZI
MAEFSVSADGSLLIGNTIFDYLKKGRPSSYVPFISVIKIDIRSSGQKATNTNNEESLKPNIELPAGTSKSIILRWTQKEPLDSKFITNPKSETLSQKMALARYIGLIASIIVFEVTSETGYTSAAIQQWLDLLDALGRGSEYGTHWSPLPIITMDRSKKSPHEHSPSSKPLSVMSEKADQGFSFNWFDTLCFSSTALQRALKRLMIAESSFNRNEFLSKSLRDAQDWVCHFKKYAETDIKHINIYNILESHIRLEAKFREIICK